MSHTTYDNHLGHSVKRLYRLMELQFNDVLRPYGIAQSQWYLLYYLNHVTCATQKELQTALGVEAATITAVVTALENKGWIARNQSTADRRAKEITLTPEGKLLWQKLPDPIAAVRERMLGSISPQDEQQARAVLDKIIANFER